MMEVHILWSKCIVDRFNGEMYLMINREGEWWRKRAVLLLLRLVDAGVEYG
jgi:hypothetical protein